MNFKKLLILLLVIIFVTSPNKIFACLSITDDLNINNPVVNANFSFQPDISPFTDCWSGAFRIRSDKNGWRLIASRVGPSPEVQNGDVQENIMASDISLEFTVMSFGMADSFGALLVSPFSSETNLASVQSGTFIISGIKKTSNSCSSVNPNYYKVTKKLCIFRDFIFNPGQYNGQVSLLLINP